MGAEISPIVAALLAAIAAWNGVWQSLSDHARAAGLVATAPGITTGAIRREGTDANPIISFASMTARGTTHGQAWEWDLGEVVLRPDPANPRRLAVEMPAPQRFHADGPLGKSTFTLWARNLGADIRLTADGTVQAITLRGEDLTLVAPDLELAATDLALSVLRRSDGRLTLEATVSDLLLPERYRLAPPMGGTVAQASLSAWAVGLTPSVPATAEAWRQADALLGLSDLSIRWGDFRATLDGRATLDSLLRPTGRFTVTAAGIGAAVAAARNAGALSEDAYLKAQDSLGLVGELRGEATVDDLRLSFSMAGGNLNWAGFRIARLPAFGMVAEEEAVSSDCALSNPDESVSPC
jgi:hypothetical protein